MTQRTIQLLIVVGIFSAVGQRPAGADEIVLKGSVRLAPEATVVRLVDVAVIDGPYASRFADTVVADAPRDAKAVEVSIRDVRHVLDEVGVHWGKVHLAGRSVILRAADSNGSGPLLAMTPATVRTNARARSIFESTAFESADDLIEQPTLRGAIARTIVRGLGLAPEDVRLRFDGRSTALLESELGLIRYEIQPLSSFSSDRIELGVREWSGGGIQARHSVTVRPMIRTQVVVLRRDVNRGTLIHEDDCSVERRWLPPSQVGIMSNLVEAVGRIAEMKLKAGDVLRKKHVKREVLIKRGHRVVVRCLVGGIVVTLETEARSAAAEGDLVELRKLGERETFFATATGPGSAITDLSR